MKMENGKKIIKSKEEKKKDFGDFIKTHVLNKTIILVIVGILLFTFVMYSFEGESKNVDSDQIELIEKVSLIGNIKARAITLLLIVLAGWVPYFYIPAIAFTAYVFNIAGDVALAMEQSGNATTLLLNIIPVLIDIVTVSIITAIGIYMTSYTTKRYKYSQRTSFSLLDAKIQLYQMTKKQEKYEDAVSMKQDRIDKMQENNVKIDYLSIIKIIPIAIVINIIACIIEYLINN